MDTEKSTTWAAPAVSIYALTLVLAALVFSYLTKNEPMMLIVVGAIVAMGTTVVNFYMGSSSSSQKKDATIAGQLTPTPVVPVAPPIVPGPPVQQTTHTEQTTQVQQTTQEAPPPVAPYAPSTT
jgi:hypothetical protein